MEPTLRLTDYIDNATYMYVTDHNDRFGTVGFNIHSMNDDGSASVREVGLQTHAMYGGPKIKYTGIELLANAVRIAWEEGKSPVLNGLPRSTKRFYDLARAQGQIDNELRPLNFQEYSTLMDRLGVETKLAA